MILFEVRHEGMQTQHEPDVRSQNDHVVNVVWARAVKPCLSHTSDITLPWEGLRTFFDFYQKINKLLLLVIYK